MFRTDLTLLVGVTSGQKNMFPRGIMIGTISVGGHIEDGDIIHKELCNQFTMEARMGK